MDAHRADTNYQWVRRFYERFYQARRSRPVTTPETQAIDSLLSQFSIEKQLEHYLHRGEGYNWESFGVYDTRKPGVILEGATKLPDNKEHALWHGIQHWCKLLTEIRRALPGASWRVHVDDHEIQWDHRLQRYDPSV